MKLGVKNFRVFKELATFDLRPITILVGPNNSGKSSFTKLLLLLKNGYDPLDFKNGDHHLGSYDRALNWNLESKEMVLQSETSISFIPDKLREEIRYDEKGKVKGQSIKNIITGKELLNIEYRFKTESSEHFSIVKDKVSLDIKYFIDLLYKKTLLVEYLEINEEKMEFKSTSLDNIREDAPSDAGKYGVVDFIRKHINLTNYKSEFDALKAYGYEKIDFIKNSVLLNTVNSIDKDYLLYDIYLNGEKVNHNNYLNTELLLWQEQYFSKILTTSSLPSDDYLSINSVIKYLNEKVKRKIKVKLKEEFEGAYEFEVRESTLGRIIFTEKLFGVVKEPHGLEESFDESLFMRFNRLLFKSFDFYQRSIYIPVNRGNQERVMSATNNDRTYKEVAKFHKISNGEEKKSLVDTFAIRNHVKYLNKVLKALNIEGEVTTEHLEDAVAVVYIEKDGRKINLADYGFGYSQLIPIVLEVYNLMGEHNSEACLIIEEPEANLHPALQAKLADILAIIIEYNPKWKLVIETHSEYLIRKLQYLVAKKEVDKDDCIIHYFNSDENVSEQEPKVKPIEINEEGNLTDNFGPGFYDEATRLQFELLKLNRNQSN